MEEKAITHQHKMILNNRHTGNVLSFDVNEILLETELGMLHIKGKDLHVNRLNLDKGEVDIDGQVDALNYSQVPGIGKKGGMLGKLFS